MPSNLKADYKNYKYDYLKALYQENYICLCDLKRKYKKAKKMYKQKIGGGFWTTYIKSCTIQLYGDPYTEDENVTVRLNVNTPVPRFSDKMEKYLSWRSEDPNLKKFNGPLQFDFGIKYMSGEEVIIKEVFISDPNAQQNNLELIKQDSGKKVGMLTFNDGVKQNLKRQIKGLTEGSGFKRLLETKIQAEKDKVSSEDY